MTIKYKWYQLYNNKRNNIQNINIENFNNKNNQKKYKEALENFQINKNVNPKEKWEEITKACLKEGENILGTKVKNKKFTDEVLTKLCEENLILRKKIEIAETYEKRDLLRKQRKVQKKKIKNRIKYLENAQLEKELQQLENIKNDSNKFYQVIKQLNRKKPKQPLCVKDEEGFLVATEPLTKLTS